MERNNAKKQQRHKSEAEGLHLRRVGVGRRVRKAVKRVAANNPGSGLFAGLIAVAATGFVVAHEADRADGEFPAANH